MAIEVNDEELPYVLHVNNDIDPYIVSEFFKIFKNHYVNGKQPEDSFKSQYEMTLRLTKEQPFYFKPRRLSFAEKNILQ